MSALVQNIYHPGYGFFAGIHEFARGQHSSKNTFLQKLASHEPPRYAVDIEFAVEDGRIDVADEVGYGGVGNLVTDDKFKREIYRFPLFSEVMRITGHELLNRPPTKSPNDPWSIEEAQAYWVARKMKILFSRLQVARECMVAGLLIHGNLKFSMTENIKLNRKTSLTKSVTTKWNVPPGGGHDPINDIAEICTEIKKTSAIIPNGVLMDGQSYEWMRASKKFLELASITFADIKVNQINQNSGAVCMGVVHAGGCRLNIWVYDGVYKNLENKVKGFIPEGKVIVGDFSANNPLMKWYYGATDALYSHKELAKSLDLSEEEIMEDIAKGQIVPTYWEDRNSLEIGLQSAMVCLPSDINMFGVLTVK